ncbi:MAG: 6-phosphofructokinase [Candidatus Omnitrophota bacterium]|nr:MAG: 6-phosphofructokinase [Candidatus Omnitrophota bacterium]
MRRIALLTSGGDAPGMNAAIRAVVRTAIYHHLEVVGVIRGYQGLLKPDFISLHLRSVSNIIGQGGTILKTARCKEFFTPEGREKGVKHLREQGIEGLIVIGGNGSFYGAHLLSTENRFPVIGIPATIDNDIIGTDFSIGSDTAVNTALSAIDKIRDTVSSMERIFVVEVMGRKEGYIALRVGLGGGAEDVLVPQTEYDIERMCEEIKEGRRKGKLSWIIIVSEGVAGSREVASLIEEFTGFETRSITLGHIQRGGSPTAMDRILASRLGKEAVEALLKGETDKMVGIVGEKIKLVELTYACAKERKEKSRRDREIYSLVKILAT